MSHHTHNSEKTVIERQAIADIDNAVEVSHTKIKVENDKILQQYPDLQEYLYEEASYNALLSKELGFDGNQIDEATNILVALVNKRTEELADMSPVMAALFQPVPDMSEAREAKPAYRNLPIDKEDVRFYEPVVSLRDYGIACRAYYSRPNNATGDPVEGVKPDVYVRRSVAETLSKLNKALAHPDVTQFFGGEVELAVDEGWRDPKLQKYLYDTVIPGLIRKEFHEREEWKNIDDGDEAFETAITAERDRKIARPPTSSNDTPSPHATAGVIDLALRYKQPTLDIQSGYNIPMGRKPAQMSDRTDPDHFEHEFPQNDEDMEAMQNRRALYAIMSGKALIETGFSPNPTEFWHWGRGDQLSELAKGLPGAYYGWPQGVFND